MKEATKIIVDKLRKIDNIEKIDYQRFTSTSQVSQGNKRVVYFLLKISKYSSLRHYKALNL